MPSRSIISSFYDISLSSPISSIPDIPDIPHKYKEYSAKKGGVFEHHNNAPSFNTNASQDIANMTKEINHIFESEYSSSKSPTLTSFSFPNQADTYYNHYISTIEREKLSEGKTYINRATDLLPYTGLLARFSQVPFNKITLVFVIVIAQIIVFTKFLQHGITEARNNAESSCNSVNSLGSSISYGPQLIFSVIGALISTQLDITISNIVQDIQSGISQFRNESEEASTSLSDSYGGIVQLSALAANSSSSNTTQYISDWIENSINSTASVIDEELNTVKSSLKELQSALSESSVLFQNISMGSVQNISLQSIRDIRVPSGINDELAMLASVRNSSFSSISDEMTQSINSLLSALNNNLEGFSNGKLYDSSAVEKYFNDSQSAIEENKICTQEAQIIDYFSHIKISLSKSFKNCIIALSVIGIVIILPVLFYEYFVSWRTLESFIRQFYENNRDDIVDRLNYLSNPTISKLGNIACKYSTNDEARSSLRWLFRYIFSETFLLLLLFVSSGFVSIICQQSLLASLVNNPNSDIPATINSKASIGANDTLTYENSIEIWANNTNIFMNQILSNITETISLEMVEPIQSINDTIDSYYTRLFNDFKTNIDSETLFASSPTNSTSMGDSILPSIEALANSTVNGLKSRQKMLLISKPLSILELSSTGNQYFMNLPGAELAKIVSTTPTGSYISKISSIEINSTLGGIIDTGNVVISVQLKIYGVLFGIWGIYFLFSSLRIAIIMFQKKRGILNKMRT